MGKITVITIRNYGHFGHGRILPTYAQLVFVFGPHAYARIHLIHGF